MISQRELERAKAQMQRLLDAGVCHIPKQSEPAKNYDFVKPRKPKEGKSEFVIFPYIMQSTNAKGKTTYIVQIQSLTLHKRFKRRCDTIAEAIEIRNELLSKIIDFAENGNQFDGVIGGKHIKICGESQQLAHLVNKMKIIITQSENEK